MEGEKQGEYQLDISQVIERLKLDLGQLHVTIAMKDEVIAQLEARVRVAEFKVNGEIKEANVLEGLSKEEIK